MSSEKGSLKWTIYGKVLPEVISSRFPGGMRVQADKEVPVSLLLCFFTRGGSRRKEGAALDGARAWQHQCGVGVQFKTCGDLPHFCSVFH